MDAYLLLLGGLATLLLSGNFLVKGGVSLARHFKISTLVVGVTVVSFGTSAPELIVSLNAALNGHPEISIGNVLGSNISNIALVLALTAIIMPVAVNKISVRTDWPFMMIVSVLFYLFILNFRLSGWEGIILFALLIAYVLFSVMHSRKKEKTNKEECMKPEFKLWLSLVIIAGSCAGLLFGAEWLVDGAVRIAKQFNVSDRVISVTIVAFGTSVPELVTSVMAAIKKEMDISVGNIIGSNIFNILGILGFTCIIKEIPVAEKFVSFDIFFMLGISVLLLLCMMPLRQPKIRRWQGFIMLASYIAYIYLVVMAKQS